MKKDLGEHTFYMYNRVRGSTATLISLCPGALILGSLAVMNLISNRPADPQRLHHKQVFGWSAMIKLRRWREHVLLMTNRVAHLQFMLVLKRAFHLELS